MCIRHLADGKFMFVHMCEHPLEPIRSDGWGERGFGHLRGKGGEWGVRVDRIF